MAASQMTCKIEPGRDSPDKTLRKAIYGGLPEKLMAAQRAGITKVFIPQENIYDLKDVAQEVKDRIEIVPVSRVTELLEAVGVLESGSV